MPSLPHTMSELQKSSALSVIIYMYRKSLTRTMEFHELRERTRVREKISRVAEVGTSYRSSSRDYQLEMLTDEGKRRRTRSLRNRANNMGSWGRRGPEYECNWRHSPECLNARLQGVTRLYCVEKAVPTFHISCTHNRTSTFDARPSSAAAHKCDSLAKAGHTPAHVNYCSQFRDLIE